MARLDELEKQLMTDGAEGAVRVAELKKEIAAAEQGGEQLAAKYKTLLDAFDSTKEALESTEHQLDELKGELDMAIGKAEAEQRKAGDDARDWFEISAALQAALYRPS